MPPLVSRPGLTHVPTGAEAQAASSTASIGQAQPGPRPTGDLPPRVPRAKDDFGLPPLRQRPRPAAATGTVESRPRETSLERAHTEAGLLGTQRWQQLNQQFGKAAWAHVAGFRRAIGPWECIGRHPIVHPLRLFVPAEGGRTVDLAKELDLAGLKAGAPLGLADAARCLGPTTRVLLSRVAIFLAMHPLGS